MAKYALLLDGALRAGKRVKEQIAGCPAIAADGGIRHAAALGIVPQLWVGDFDSAEPALARRFSAVEQRRFPAEKDKTDGGLAAEAALERGADALVLCGAFGGARIEHSLAHINLAIALQKRGIACLLTDGETEGTPILPGQCRFDWPEGTLFSLIAMSDIEGLTIHGAKWNTENKRLSCLSSAKGYALSNESCGRVTISVAKGYGILLARFILP